MNELNLEKKSFGEKVGDFLGKPVVRAPGEIDAVALAAEYEYEEDDAELELDDGLDSLMNLLHLIRNDKVTSDRQLAKMLWDGMNRVWGED